MLCDGGVLRLCAKEPLPPSQKKSPASQGTRAILVPEPQGGPSFITVLLSEDCEGGNILNQDKHVQEQATEKQQREIQIDAESLPK